MAPQTTDRPPAAQEATVSDAGPRARRRADFPARLDGAPMRLGNALWPNPFWLRVSDGVIVEIEEQYIP